MRAIHEDVPRAPARALDRRYADRGAEISQGCRTELSRTYLVTFRFAARDQVELISVNIIVDYYDDRSGSYFIEPVAPAIATLFERKHRHF